MGLHDRFDPIRNQILLMEPLPTVNKAYSMVFRVEKQMDVQASLNTDSTSTTLYFKTQQSGNRPSYENHDTGGYRKKDHRKMTKNVHIVEVWVI